MTYKDKGFYESSPPCNKQECDVMAYALDIYVNINILYMYYACIK